jgi:transposase-like protein
MVTMDSNEDWLARRFDLSAETITSAWLVQVRCETQALLEENDRLRATATQMADKLAVRGACDTAAGGIQEKCDGCRFWRNARPHPRADGLLGECRRHAPIAAFTTSNAFGERPTWPCTFDNDWCGAWQEAA